MRPLSSPIPPVSSGLQRALLGALLAASPMLANATAFLVNDGGDADDFNLADGVCNTTNDNTNPSCSLRAAIRQGNNANGDHSIAFTVPMVTIQNGALDSLNARFDIVGNGLTVIDGQYDAATSTIGYGCLNLLDSGTAALGHTNGADGSTINGLILIRCNGDAISANGHGYTISNNFIGLLPSGTKMANSGSGISLTASAVYPDTTTLNHILNSLPAVPVDASQIAAYQSALATAWAAISAPINITNNTISGNDQHGVNIHGMNQAAVIVAGNRIGTDPTGTTAVPNGQHGVYLNAFTFSNMIGPNNVIAGNGEDGIRVDAGEVPLPNYIMGNRIGLGLVAGSHVGNDDNGVYTNTRASDGSTAGTLPNPFGTSLYIGPSNEISDNQGMVSNSTPTSWPDDPSFDVYAGIYLTSNSHQIKVIGNTIGLASFGGSLQASNAYGNAGDGIIVTSSDNMIGGTAASDANVIAGNTRHGIVVRGSAVTGTRILGNYLGVHPGLASNFDIGNALDGVLVNSSLVNAIGGSAAGEANTIAGNGRHGVSVRKSSTGLTIGWGNLVQQNRIFHNGGLGIDLERSLNAEDDPARSENPTNYANGDQVQPVICLGTAADTGSCVGASAPAFAAGSTTLEWTLASHAGDFRVEFYVLDGTQTSTATGMSFLAEQNISRNASGFTSAICSATRCSSTLVGDTRGKLLLMTVTEVTTTDVPPLGDGAGVTDGPTNNTSEFSNGVVIALPAGTPPVFGAVPPQNASVDVAFSLDLSTFVTATDGDPIDGYQVSVGSLPAGLQINVPSLGMISGTPTAAGNVSFSVQAHDANGDSNAASVQIDVAQGSQSIVFGPPPALVAGGAPGVIVVQGGASGNPVVLNSLTPTVCTISGTSVTPLLAGQCQYTADQAGNANYLPAPQASSSATVAAAPGTPPVMGDVPDQTPSVGQAFSLALMPFVTPTDGDPILDFHIASGTLPAGLNLDAVSGVIAGTPTSAGNVTVSVTARDQHGDSNADSVSFVVAMGSQSINFPAIANMSISAADFTPSASASSTLSVSITSQTPAICTTNANLVHLVAIGTCTLRASQPGDANWNAATPVDQSFDVVSAAGPATHLQIASPASATAGQAFDITVNALDANNVLASSYVGTVHFSGPGGATVPADYTFTASDGSSHTFSGGVTLQSSGVITATDTANASITGSSANIPVGLAATQTALSSSVQPAVFGQTITLTATVTTAVGTPSGSVSFTDGATSLCASVALDTATGQATCSSSALEVGAHALQASYSGDAAFAASVGSFSQTVNPAATSTSVVSHTPNPSAAMQPITVTATVSVTAPGAGTPTGTLTLSAGGGSCTATLPQTSCQLTPASVGSTPVSAVYSGDGHFAASNAPLAGHTVTPVTNLSLPSATGSGTLQISVSGNGCSFTQATPILAPAGAPVGASFPHGLVDFTLRGCVSGSADVSIVYPSGLPAGSEYWKYLDSSASWTQLNAANLSGDTVTFTLVDDGPYDDDPTEGTIRDPSGPAVISGTPPRGPQLVPALDARSLIVLVLAVLSLAVLGIGRSRQ